MAATLMVGACGEDDREAELVPDNPIGLDHDCTMDVEVGTTVQTCDGIGFTITYPERCAEEACGLILDLHGHSYGPDAHDADTHLRELGGEAGFIVVQPTAPRQVGGKPWWFPQDDVHLVEFVRHASVAWSVAPDRVHVMGTDLGGYAAWRVVCDYTEVFASAAILGAGTSDCAPVLTSDSCDFTGDGPAVELDILVGHGAHDPHVDLACSQAQVDAVAAAWSLDPTGLDEHDNFVRTTLTNDVGTRVDHLVYDWETDYEDTILGPYRGHCVPGGDGDLGCTDPDELVWGREVIAFFSR
jgi:hypothetical protein